MDINVNMEPCKVSDKTTKYKAEFGAQKIDKKLLHSQTRSPYYSFFRPLSRC